MMLVGTILSIPKFSMVPLEEENDKICGLEIKYVNIAYKIRKMKCVLKNKVTKIKVIETNS